MNRRPFSNILNPVLPNNRPDPMLQKGLQKAPPDGIDPTVWMIAGAIDELKGIFYEQTQLLNQLVAKNSQQLDAFIDEYAMADLNQTTLNWQPQIRDNFHCHGFLVILPVGTTSATLILGQRTYPIQNTYTIMSPLDVIISRTERSLVWTPASSTVNTVVQVWGEASPGNIPGFLH